MADPVYVAKPTGHRKYVRDLLRDLPNGFRIGMIEELGDERNRSGRRISKTHPGVLTPDGRLLRGEDGRPVTVCNTPGSRGSLAADLRTIRRAIEADRQHAGTPRN